MYLLPYLCTCLIYVPSKYSDLCLLTGADEIGPMQKLTNALTVQRVLRENLRGEATAAEQLFDEYLKYNSVQVESKRKINNRFLERGSILFAQNVDRNEEEHYLEDWYKSLWKGFRREIELNVSVGTLLLFESRCVSLENFLQYFVNLLSISALTENAKPEVILAKHCFMSAEL